MLNIDNDDLFISCISALRDKDILLLDEENIKRLKRKAVLLLKESVLPVQKLLENFMENVNI